MRSEGKKAMLVQQSRDPDYELWVLLAETRYAMLKAREKEMRQYSVSHRQTVILSIIKDIGAKATPAEVTRRVFRAPHSISGILNRMEKAGLIRRVKDLQRKNMVRLVITEKGHKAYMDSLKRESVHRVFSVLSEEQRLQLVSCLKPLRERALAVLRERAPINPHPS